MNKITSINGILLTPQNDFYQHEKNNSAHLTEDERTAWNSKAEASEVNSKVSTEAFDAHKTNATVHITEEERSQWNAAPKVDESGNMTLAGSLTTTGTYNANGGINIGGPVTFGAVQIPADVLPSLYKAATHYYAYQYEWTRENIIRDFCDGTIITALPDDMPEPAALTALTNGTNLFTLSKLTRLPSSWRFPNLTICTGMFRQSDVDEVTISSTNITSCDTLIYGAAKCRRIHMDFGNVTSLSYMAEGAGLVDFKHNLKNVTNVNNAFMSNKSMVEFGSALPKAMYATNFMSWNFNLKTCRYPVDANGQSIYESGLDQALDAEGNGLYAYLTLPEIVAGGNAFHATQLDLPTALSIINSLRMSADGITGATWELTIGIHVDHKSAPELLAAIEGATHRGWTVTVQWNGTSTSKAKIRQLEKVWCKAVPGETGDYVDQNGTRYIVDWGHLVISKTMKNEELGYSSFDSLDDALDQWGLTKQRTESLI